MNEVKVNVEEIRLFRAGLRPPPDDNMVGPDLVEECPGTGHRAAFSTTGVRTVFG
jgi:hypothetical protein